MKKQNKGGYPSYDPRQDGEETMRLPNGSGGGSWGGDPYGSDPYGAAGSYQPYPQKNAGSKTVPVLCGVAAVLLIVAVFLFLFLRGDKQTDSGDPAASASTQTASSGGTANGAAAPVVTKDPVDAVISAGGDATFLALATDYSSVAWHLINSDGSSDIAAADAAGIFGCGVSGSDSEALTLSDVPASMDGWQVEAVFSGPGGTTRSLAAHLSVGGGQADQQQNAQSSAQSTAPSASDLESYRAQLSMPKASQYLDRRVSVTVTPWKDVSIYAFKDPERTSRPDYLIEPGSVGTAVAEARGFSCVIFPDLDIAAWVNYNYLSTEPYVPNVSSGVPNAGDLDAVYSHIVYPRANQYLSAYRKSTVDPPNGQGVYAFVDPVAKTNGYYFVVMPGEEVTVLAEYNGFCCVILDRQGRAAWINADYLP